jgi:hypothetical protein
VLLAEHRGIVIIITLRWYPYFNFTPTELFAGREFFFLSHQTGFWSSIRLVLFIYPSYLLIIIQYTPYSICSSPTSIILILFSEEAKNRTGWRPLSPKYLVDGGVRCATLLPPTNLSLLCLPHTLSLGAFLPFVSDVVFFFIFLFFLFSSHTVRQNGMATSG